MAGSRGQYFGTIYKRTQGLIRSGALRREKIPLWFNVYEAFPPLDTFNPEEKEPDIAKRIKRINYPEDLIRLKFYDEYSSPEVVNLESSVDTLSQKFSKGYIAKKSLILKKKQDVSESEQTEERLEPSEKTEEETGSDVSFEEMLKVFAYDHNLGMKEEDIQRQKKKKRRESIQMREQKVDIRKQYRPESIIGTWDELEKS